MEGTAGGVLSSTNQLATQVKGAMPEEWAHRSVHSLRHKLNQIQRQAEAALAVGGGGQRAVAEAPQAGPVRRKGVKRTAVVEAAPDYGPILTPVRHILNPPTPAAGKFST